MLFVVPFVTYRKKNKLLHVQVMRGSKKGGGGVRTPQKIKPYKISMIN